MDHAASAATPIDEWFEIIKKNATKNPTKEDYDQFVKFTKDHEKDFAAQDDKSNPLFWQDAAGNNALHLLLATHEIDGEKGSPLFWLLMRNAQFEGKKDALLQTNNKLDSAFKIGIKNYKIRKKSGLFGKEVRGDVYLTSNDGDFLTKSSTKVDDNGNTLLHIMALASGVESFLKLQKIMIANLKAKDSDFELKFLMGQRNAAKRTPS